MDAQHALIVAHEVTSEATDNRSLAPMAAAAQCEARGIEPFVPPNRSDNTRGGGTLFAPTEFTYDSKSDTFRCPADQLLVRKQLMRAERAVLYTTSACGSCALKARCTTGRQRHVMRHLFESELQRMRTRIEQHPQAMRLRRSTVEHPFGTIKYQIFGHPRFLLRSRWDAGSEMAIAVLAYNLKRVANLLGNAGLVRKLIASSA